MAKRAVAKIKSNTATSRTVGQKMSKSGDKVVRGLRTAAAGRGAAIKRPAK